MKTVQIIVGLGLLALAGSARADSKVTTVIDGKEVGKDLTRLTFDDKLVTLTFSDNSTETADMALVAVALDHSAQSSLETIVADPTKSTGVYNLRGQYLGEKPEGLSAGVYIVNGKKVLVK